jgi:hypothetical protein
MATLAVNERPIPGSRRAPTGLRLLPIFKTFPLGEVTEALALMRANKHFGKIVLTM